MTYFEQHAFNPDRFRRNGHRLVDLLASFLEGSVDRKPAEVLRQIDPEKMLDLWEGAFQDAPTADLFSLIERVLAQSNNLQHPRYIGHQCCTPLPTAALVDLVGTLLNNGSAVYEMGPVNVAMERRLVSWMAGLIGYDTRSDGVFTNGGTVGNLTALLVARGQAVDYDIWKTGYDRTQPLGVLVSQQCHYSVTRAIGVMGLGEAAVYSVPVDDAYQMTQKGLSSTYERVLRDGRQPFAVVGNGCATATGRYDDLNRLADFAEHHQLWFHVDGAHGASALLSPRYRHLLAGVHRADSIVWDAHKMLMIPALATAVIFKNGAHSFEAFSQRASYLFSGEPQEEWYNYAHRTMECTKSMMGLKLYVPLKVYGVGLFQRFIEHTFDLTEQFADMIAAASDFELAVRPQSNIICFRYTPVGAVDLNGLQRRIRQALLRRGRFYIVQTKLNQELYLRCTIINPNTQVVDLTELLKEIRHLGTQGPTPAPADQTYL
ncbi:MAG: pyridoxal-dependent decarboxylase [Myxococcota bacterium]|nr:pyridoxal-dependent decarboxylase [Myxococcota bacterium]